MQSQSVHSSHNSSQFTAFCAIIIIVDVVVIVVLVRDRIWIMTKRIKIICMNLILTSVYVCVCAFITWKTCLTPHFTPHTCVCACMWISKERYVKLPFHLIIIFQVIKFIFREHIPFYKNTTIKFIRMA